MSPYAAGAWAYGGIPRLLGTMTTALAARGHHVTVCATDACDADSRLPLAWTDAGRPAGNRPVWRLFPNVSNRLAYHRQFFTPRGLNAYLAAHAREFDVAHLHACRNLPGVLAVHHLRRAGVPYVLSPNGTAPRLERAYVAKRAFDLIAGTRVLRSASRVIAVSHAEEAQLRALHVPPGAIAHVPNPVDVDEFEPPIARGRFRAAWRLDQAPLILFLGKLTPRKRVDVLVDAFARLRHPQARLVIAGNDMGTRQVLMSQVSRLGLDERTTFCGLLRGRDRLEALADADVVVYPSEDEIFGLVPLEALLAGTPVIVGGDSGCAEIVRGIAGGTIVETGDVEALATALSAVLRDVGAARAAAAAASLRVRARYSADTVVRQLEAVYFGLVQGAMVEAAAASA